MSENARAERAHHPLDLTDPRTLTAVARRVGLRRDTHLGQHFLVDRDVLDAIVEALDPAPDSEVLEIGCGLGTLTGALASRARRVVAIDIDPACVAGTEITQRAHPNVSVLEAIYHVVEHFSGHTGQIIYATKLLTGEDLGYYKHLRTTAAHAERTP